MRFDEMSPERHREICALAVKKRAKVFKERKQMREQLQDFLHMTLRKGDEALVTNLEEVDGRNVTVQTALMAAMLKKALAGDVQAAQFIRDTSGNKPVDKQEISGGLPIFIKDDLE